MTSSRISICSPRDVDETRPPLDDFFAFLDAFTNGDLCICVIDQDGDCDADDFFIFLDLFA